MNDHGTGDHERNANLYALLREGFVDRLDRPFLRLPTGETTTYRSIEHRSAQFAGALRARGLLEGDRVLSQVEKSVDAVAFYLACLRLGVIFVTLNTAYTDSEVEFFATDSRPSLIVRGPGQTAIDGFALASLGTQQDGTFAQEADTAIPFTDIVKSGPEDIAAMLYTSGTTGRSKGAMITHNCLATNGRALQTDWAFTPEDILLHALPVFHVHGLFVALHPAMLAGCEVIFLDRFSTDAVIRFLPESTIYMGVPTHYIRLIADSGFTPEAATNMRLFTSGSAPLTEINHQEFEARSGHRILERYGMTETGIITSNPLTGDRVAGTVGYPMPGFELRVADDAGQELPSGEAGSVEVRSEALFAGYWELPDKTKESFRDDGFFITGDVGQVDESGRLTLEGRTSDMIISGGLNVYPKEIEMAIDEMPGVRESAVVGLPHGDFGEAVAAFVVAEPGVVVDLSTVTAHLGATMARFKVPKAVVALDALPRNTMAKVQKKQLRTDHANLFIN